MFVNQDCSGQNFDALLGCDNSSFMKSLVTFRLHKIITGQEARNNSQLHTVESNNFCDCIKEPRNSISASWTIGLHPALRVCDDYIGIPSSNGKMARRTLYEELLQVFVKAVHSQICLNGFHC